MRAVAAVLALSAIACGGARVAPEPALLRVIAEPETAAVYVDDRFVGSARVLRLRPEALRPGVHFVTLQAPGHFPHDVEVSLPEGETTVRVRLRAVPP